MRSSKARAGIDHSDFEDMLPARAGLPLWHRASFLLQTHRGSLGRTAHLTAIGGSGFRFIIGSFYLRITAAVEEMPPPSVLASIAYDMLNNRILVEQLKPQCVGERTLVIRHIDNFLNHYRTYLLYTMFFFDRRYAAKKLILFIKDDMHCRYLFKVKDEFSLKAEALPAPDSKEKIAVHIILLYEGHRVRVIKLYLPSGIL